MAEVKWIKLSVDMFDHHKIKYLRRLPEGNNIVLVWIMLLTLAGRCNSGGMIFLTENVPYTISMLADELGFKENTVSMALSQLNMLGMIYVEDNCFVIKNWNKHQSLDRNLDMREYNRIAKQKSRVKQKTLTEVNECQMNLLDMSIGEVNDNVNDLSKDVNDNVNDASKNVNDMSMTCQRCQTTEERRKKEEEEREEESKREEERETELESQSIIHSGDSESLNFLLDEPTSLEIENLQKHIEMRKKRFYQPGGLGGGLVFLSDDQIDDLLDKLSNDEFDKYVDIIADCERKGKHFKKKTHYTAILEMAVKDRKIMQGEKL